MSGSPLYFLTITELAGSIREKQVSPVAVTEAMLSRIEALDGRYNSYATVMADHAMESAQRAENEIAAGRYLGPLHGVPVAVKDLCFTRGVPTMGDTPVLSGHIPDFDATVISKLASAGAVLLGKLNLTEVQVQGLGTATNFGCARGGRRRCARSPVATAACTPASWPACCSTPPGPRSPPLWAHCW